MTARSTCLVAGALLALVTAPASAQLAAACRGDVQRFCEGTPLGGGRVIRCLEENAAKLSQGCRKVMGIQEAPGGGDAAGGNGAASGGAESAKTACRSDAMRFCSDAVGDQAKMKTCLRSHAAQLSDGCKTALIAGGS
jgi:Cysteine rich repeat